MISEGPFQLSYSILHYSRCTQISNSVFIPKIECGSIHLVQIGTLAFWVPREHLGEVPITVEHFPL